MTFSRFKIWLLIISGGWSLLKIKIKFLCLLHSLPITLIILSNSCIRPKLSKHCILRCFSQLLNNWPLSSPIPSNLGRRSRFHPRLLMYCSGSSNRTFVPNFGHIRLKTRPYIHLTLFCPPEYKMKCKMNLKWRRTIVNGSSVLEA